MRVAVVGAGITGLAVTHYLARADIDVVTFEAATEPGGVMRSRRVDGHLLEYGPQRLRRTGELADLIDVLDLDDELLLVEDDPPLYIYADGRLRTVPRSGRELLATDLLTWREKFRLAGEPFTGSLDPDETIADEITRMCGEGVYRKLVEPIVGGMYASDPREMPVGYALDSLLSFEATHRSLVLGALKRSRSGTTLPPVASFEDGVQTLPRAIYEHHEPDVQLGQAVTSIERFMGGQFAVRTGGGSVGVDHVIVTTPATTTASLLADVDDCDVESLATLRYNDLVLVHLEAELDRPGFGYQVQRDEDFSTLGVTWNGQLLGRQGVQTAFLGGMYDPDIIERSEEKLGEIAAGEFESVTGEPASVIDVTKLPAVIPAYDRSWSALEELSLSEDVTVATNYTGRIGVPGRLRQAKAIAGRIAGTTDGE